MYHVRTTGKEGGMKRICLCFWGLLICISGTMALYPGVTFAETCEKWVARVTSVQGTVEARRVNETQWQQVKLNDTFCAGDMIRVQERSRADIALVNQPVLRLDQNTTITLGGVKEGGASLVELVKGAAHFFSRVARNLNVQTAFVNAGVEGTEFFIRVEDNRTILSVFEGKVLAANKTGSLAVTGGQSAVAEEGKAPVPYIMVRPRDAVQWALYYPPVMYHCPEELKENDTLFYTCRASSLLQVGRVDEARADIGKALTAEPNNSNALALESVIAVVQNDKEKALGLGKRAVEADPKSASARIALSYAQQANFDLNGALESLKEAVKVQPDNALAWARLAELHESFGNLGEALEAARKAVELDLRIERTQMVLGFAYLLEVKTDRAKDAFEKAIELDNADPLPRLGLGLTKIRDGHLEEGTREIEIAASLDPNNALVRSYFGKAYYEEKREKQASEEYAMAQKLDPLDPTPYFYDAILKQTTNRPVEALHDMEKAIELNDNRAVYRSQLLLDSDLAARSASVARIYSDLGFQDLALVEGWKSVNTDPSDFSGHRFLADSYSILPRHEIARVSELLQSQLLQPLNMTPIQPRLAESNLFLISAQGPASLSFNEFNPLFNRDGVTLQASGLGGGNGTWGGEAVAAGIYKKASISAGYTHFATDGWRDNADQKDQIANVFVQVELSPQTSVEAEYRYRDDKRGDVSMNFFEDNNDPFRLQKIQTNSVRVGGRHAFSPDSILIGNLQYSHANSLDSGHYILDAAGFGLEPPPVVDAYKYPASQDAYSSELSYIYRSKYVDFVAGGGAFIIDQDVDYNDNLFWPGEEPPLSLGKSVFPVRLDINHYNLYGYGYIKPLRNLTLTLGASGDFYDSDDKNSDSTDMKKNQFNPKFGITWTPFDGTTVRGAAFRTLKRTLITDQTLEPTQVAGFNQFFDDINATEAWVYGVAVDQKFSRNIYGGVEFSGRNLEVPYFTGFETLELKEADWKERQVRTYLYWTPHKWLALGAGYGYEHFKYTDNVNLGAKKIDTHSVPLRAGFFHPSGLFASVQGTYYNQKGDFQRFSTGMFESADDSFWLVDAIIGYRFPKRYGFLTVGVRNLFDKEFKYFEVDPNNLRITPDRQVFCKVTLAFP
jgi:Flp pilus assembly protein TadD